MIKLVAFDWNGTILSDTFAIYESDQDVARLLNINRISFKDFQKYFDVPVKRMHIALGASEEELDQKAEQIAQTFHTRYEIRAARVRTRANARELLEWLSKNNIPSIIFSNHVLEPIRKQLKRLNLEKYFTEILANGQLSSALKGRNKKEKLKNYLDQNNFKSEEVLIIGDTVEEIEIGRELGITTTAITHGNCSTTRLKVARPDYLIAS